MLTKDEDSASWQRNSECTVKVRGMSPWACSVVKNAHDLGHDNSVCQATNAYSRGALKLLEEMAPQCLNCSIGHAESKFS